MKFFALILSIYIMMLSFVPCTDSMECHNVTETEVKATTYDNHQHEQEQCPPLCYCTCCSINSGQPAHPLLLSFSKPVKIVAKHFSDYQFTYLNTNLSAVWQPPRA